MPAICVGTEAGMKLNPPGPIFGPLPIACEHCCTLDHRMGPVGRMPMLSNVDCFGRSNEQLGGVRTRIDMENTNFRRIVSQISFNFHKFQRLRIVLIKHVRFKE